MSGGCCAWADETSTALLASSSIDRKGGPGREGEMNGACSIDHDSVTSQQIAVGSRRHGRRDGYVEARRAVVDRDESFRAARKRDRIRAVVPPVVDVRPRHDMAKAHHVPDRWIAMLAHPVAHGGGLEARGAADGCGPAARIGRRPHRITRRAIERVARPTRVIAISLRSPMAT